MKYQGRYRLINTSKYRGNPTNVIYRSSWELKFMKWCDHSEAVLEWASEEFYIPYISPLDRKIHRYFPDFKIRIRTKSGEETWVVEIKPLNQVMEPKIQTRMTRKYINEVKTYAVNKYKWDFAEQWCKDRNYKFVIFTEKDLGIRN